MSGQQVTWDEPSQQPPPQVKWDDEAKPPTFLGRLRGDMNSSEVKAQTGPGKTVDPRPFGDVQDWWKEAKAHPFKAAGSAALNLAPLFLGEGSYEPAELPPINVRGPGEIPPTMIRPRAYSAGPGAEPIPSRSGLQLEGDVAPSAPLGRVARPNPEPSAALGKLKVPEPEILPPLNIRRPGEVAPEMVQRRAFFGGQRAEPIPSRSGLVLPGEVAPPPAPNEVPSTEAAPVHQGSAESIPRTLSGESALRQILPSNNADLLKIARSRGLNVNKEMQLKPGVADKMLVEKIINDYSPEELDEMRSRYLENTRFRRPLGDIGEEGINTLRKQTYFPDLKVSDAAVKRTRAAMANNSTGETKGSLIAKANATRGQLPTDLNEDLTPQLEKSLVAVKRNRGSIGRGTLNANPERLGAEGQSQAVPAARQPGTPPAAGAETTIRVPGEDRAYPASYQVRELADVQPSHSGINFNPNEKYALTNDRDYSNSANQGKIVTNSAPGKFDPAYHVTDNPDATNGPVVIDSDGHALGGNGRTMILQRVYKYNPEGAQAYKDLLVKKAQNFGLNGDDIAKMKEPVLVREIKEKSRMNISPRTPSRPLSQTSTRAARRR